MSGLALLLGNLGALCVVAGAVLKSRPGQEQSARALLIGGALAAVLGLVLSGIAMAQE